MPVLKDAHLFISWIFYQIGPVLASSLGVDGQIILGVFLPVSIIVTIICLGRTCWSWYREHDRGEKTQDSERRTTSRIKGTKRITPPATKGHIVRSLPPPKCPDIDQESSRHIRIKKNRKDSIAFLANPIHKLGNAMMPSTRVRFGEHGKAKIISESKTDELNRPKDNMISSIPLVVDTNVPTSKTKSMNLEPDVLKVRSNPYDYKTSLGSFAQPFSLKNEAIIRSASQKGFPGNEHYVPDGCTAEVPSFQNDQRSSVSKPISSVLEVTKTCTVKETDEINDQSFQGQFGVDSSVDNVNAQLNSSRIYENKNKSSFGIQKHDVKRCQFIERVPENILDDLSSDDLSDTGSAVASYSHQTTGRRNFMHSLWSNSMRILGKIPKHFGHYVQSSKQYPTSRDLQRVVKRDEERALASITMLSEQVCSGLLFERTCPIEERTQLEPVFLTMRRDSKLSAIEVKAIPRKERKLQRQNETSLRNKDAKPKDVKDVKNVSKIKRRLRFDLRSTHDKHSLPFVKTNVTINDANHTRDQMVTNEPNVTVTSNNSKYCRPKFFHSYSNTNISKNKRKLNEPMDNNDRISEQSKYLSSLSPVRGRKQTNKWTNKHGINLAKYWRSWGKQMKMRSANSITSVNESEEYGENYNDIFDHLFAEAEERSIKYSK